MTANRPKEGPRNAQLPEGSYTKKRVCARGCKSRTPTSPLTTRLSSLDQLSDTGLKNIVVGSFVSPKWTPQMERIDEIVTRFTPKPGITYTALALKLPRRGARPAVLAAPDHRARPLPAALRPYVRRFSPAATPTAPRCRKWKHGRSGWAQAQELNVKEAGIGCNASWGLQLPRRVPGGQPDDPAGKGTRPMGRGGHQRPQRLHGRPHEPLYPGEGRGESVPGQGALAGD